MDSGDVGWARGSRAFGFSANSDDTATLVKEWLSARPAELKEVIWYRIPVATDQRNWRWPTLTAIMAGRKPIHSLQAVQRGDNPIDLSIKNMGGAGKKIGPKLTVTWTRDTHVSLEAFPGWTVAASKEHAVFTRVEKIPLELPPGSERSIGWLRFDRVANATCLAEEFAPDRHSPDK